MSSPTAVEAAVIDAMIQHGPDGHVDGYEEIAKAALAAAGVEQLRADRDRARTIAVALEQEVAVLREALDGER